MSIKQYYNLMRLWVRRRINHDEYIKLQLARARLIQEELNPFMKPAKGLKLLDIGSHRGGYSIYFAKQGYKVTGLEISQDRITTSRRASEKYGLNIEFVLGDARNMQFKDNTYNVVMLSNVIEHIKGTKGLLKEIYRIMKPGGILYIQFPPYWGVFGAHIYFKFFPLPLHYLTPRIANPLIRAFHLDSDLNDLEKLTIDRLIKLSKDTNFKIKMLKSFPSGIVNIRFMRELSPFCKLILEK